MSFAISKLVQEVYESHSYAAAQKGLRYTFSISHKVPSQVRGDVESIRKALSVIVAMAIEDCSKDLSGGSVQINVDLVSPDKLPHVVKFSVSDSSMKFPYWFSISLESVSSKQTG